MRRFFVPLSGPETCSILETPSYQRRNFTLAAIESFDYGLFDFLLVFLVEAKKEKPDFSAIVGSKPKTFLTDTVEALRLHCEASKRRAAHFDIPAGETLEERPLSASTRAEILTLRFFCGLRLFFVGLMYACAAEDMPRVYAMEKASANGKSLFGDLFCEKLCHVDLSSADKMHILKEHHHKFFSSFSEIFRVCMDGQVSFLRRGSDEVHAFFTKLHANLTPYNRSLVHQAICRLEQIITERTSRYFQVVEKRADGQETFCIPSYVYPVTPLHWEIIFSDVAHQHAIKLQAFLRLFAAAVSPTHIGANDAYAAFHDAAVPLVYGCSSSEELVTLHPYFRSPNLSF
jgi:hypothetical protein